MYRGGNVSANYDGAFKGTNKTGKADAAFLNALNIKWTLDTQPQLIRLYSKPEQKTDGFNMSLNDAINRSNLSLDDTLLLLSNTINARKKDALTHQLKRHDVHGGHGHIYALTRWLHDEYVQSLFPNPSPMENKDHMLNVYYQEFINMYEQNQAPTPLPPAAAAAARPAADKFLMSIRKGGKMNNKIIKRKATTRKATKTRKTNMKPIKKRKSKTKTTKKL